MFRWVAQSTRGISLGSCHPGTSGDMKFHLNWESVPLHSELSVFPSQLKFISQMREGSLIITTHTLRIPFSSSSTFFSRSLCAEREILQRGRQRLQSLVYLWSPWRAWHPRHRPTFPLTSDPVPLPAWAWFRRELVAGPVIPASPSGWEMQEGSLMLLLDTKALVIFRKGNQKKKSIMMTTSCGEGNSYPL